VQLSSKVRELQRYADAERAAGRRIALVPTMGALHAGHLALVDAGRARAERVIVSIFVNPTQFNNPGDLATYPRTLEADLEACRGRGVDVVFAPEASEMYPPGEQTRVEVDALAKPLCGASRPGHFRGVTTVVAKLFLAARPHFAIFGQKDFQQLAVVRRMARDLLFDLEVVGVPTVREPDGLALSSRNLRLTPESRRQALALSRALAAAERELAAGERRADRVLRAAHAELEKSPLLRVDYAELRDPETLALASDVLTGPALFALAAFLPAREPGQEVRLIDNRVLDPAAAGRPGEEDRP
jgi:pantoate--beta-alanine ligase